MKKLKEITKKLIHDESGQGATEYILLLVVIVGMVVLFGPRIKGMVEAKLADVEGQMSGFSGN